MPELANRVEIDHERRELRVDGQKFPWHITEDGPSIRLDSSGLCFVTVTFMANNAEVTGHA